MTIDKQPVSFLVMDGDARQTTPVVALRPPRQGKLLDVPMSLPPVAAGDFLKL